MNNQIRIFAVLLFIAVACSASPQDTANVNEHHFLTTGGSVKVLLVNTSPAAEPVAVDYLSAEGVVLRTDYPPTLMPSDAKQFSATNVPSGTSEIVVRASTAVRVSPASAHLQPAAAQTIITGSPWKSLAGPWAANCNGTFGAIMVAPSDPKTILIGSSDLSNGCGVFRSSDGGQSWSAQNSGIGQVGLLSKHFPPITTFAPTSDSSVIYMGTYNPLGGGSIYVTKDGGSHWSLASGSVNFFGVPEVANAISLAADPNNPNTVYAGLLANGVYKTTNGGQHWTQIRSGGPSDVYHVVKFLDSQTLITAGGTTYDSAPCFIGPSTLGDWESIDCSGVLPLGPAVTTDGGSHWNYLTYTGAYAVNSIFFSGIESVQANGSWTSYAATMGAGIVIGPIPVLIGPKGIFKVSSGGGAWMKAAGVDSTGTDYPVTGLTADVKDASKVFAYIPSKTIFESPDGGASWSAMDLPLGASSINKLQAGDNHLYALTDRGVFDYTPAPPSVTSVSPNPITGSNSPQTVTITGTGFTSASTVTLGNAYSTYPNVTITSRTATQLVVSATFGTTAATWWAKTVNGSLSSNQYNFQVNAPAAATPFFTGLGYSPNPAKAAQVVNLAFYGGNFIAGTTQVWFVGPGCAGQGCQTNAVSVVSSAYMSAQAVLNSPGSYAVNVRNGSGTWVTAGSISVVR